MSIMTRFIRLCKADIHGVMDQLEDKELLLKQYLRDMEKELGEQEARLRLITLARESIHQDYRKYEQEIAQTEDEIETAIQKDKDDIARFLIKKIKPIVRLHDETGRKIESSDTEINQLQESIAQRQQQLSELQLRSQKYLHTMKSKDPAADLSDFLHIKNVGEPSAEEVESELFRRKEKLGKEVRP